MKIQVGFKLLRTEYFKVHVDQIIGNYNSVVFDRIKKQKKGDYPISVNEVIPLSEPYRELNSVPQETLRF